MVIVRFAVRMAHSFALILMIGLARSADFDAHCAPPAHPLRPWIAAVSIRV